MLEDDGAGLNRGWLGSEAAFRVVKEYQNRNLIVPIVGDFAGDWKNGCLRKDSRVVAIGVERRTCGDLAAQMDRPQRGAAF